MTRPLVIRTAEDRRRVAEHIANLSLEGKPWEVTVERWRNRRSQPQNNTYWMWLAAIADETGHTKDELHDVFRRMFLPVKTIEIGGKQYEALTSTTSLSTAEMAEYMERVAAVAATDLGILLPAPEYIGEAALQCTNDCA